MRATHIAPNSPTPGRAPTLPRPEPPEIADAITVRASASHAERLARLAARHDHTIAGRRPQAGRQQPNRVGAQVCSDLELAVLALHGSGQFAAAARLASAPGQALAYPSSAVRGHTLVAGRVSWADPSESRVSTQGLDQYFAMSRGVRGVVGLESDAR